MAEDKLKQSLEREKQRLVKKVEAIDAKLKEIESPRIGFVYSNRKV